MPYFLHLPDREGPRSPRALRPIVTDDDVDDDIAFADDKWFGTSEHSFVIGDDGRIVERLWYGKKRRYLH